MTVVGLFPFHCKRYREIVNFTNLTNQKVKSIEGYGDGLWGCMEKATPSSQQPIFNIHKLFLTIKRPTLAYVQPLLVKFNCVCALFEKQTKIYSRIHEIRWWINYEKSDLKFLQLEVRFNFLQLHKQLVVIKFVLRTKSNKMVHNTCEVYMIKGLTNKN